MLSRMVELHGLVHMDDGKILVRAFQAREQQGPLAGFEHAALLPGALADDPQPLAILSQHEVWGVGARKRHVAPPRGGPCTAGKSGHGIFAPHDAVRWRLDLLWCP